jgi:hypothetical protein
MKITEHPYIKEMKVKDEAKEKHYFISYHGQQKVLSLSGVGKIIQGREYEVTKDVANCMRHDEDWLVIER